MHEDYVYSPLVPIFSSEMIPNQENDQFCCKSIPCLNKEDRVPFPVADCDLLFLSTHGNEQFVVPKQCKLECCTSVILRRHQLIQVVEDCTTSRDVLSIASQCVSTVMPLQIRFSHVQRTL